MIKKETLMDIRSLAKKGHSRRQIAKMTGLNRRTVSKYLEEGTLPVYQQQQRQSKLESFKPLINGWLEQTDYQATRIHEMLIGEGFDGSYSTVRRYVESIKERRARKAYIRFETTPGQQAQVDFGDFQIQNADGTSITIYCFMMVLGYSRHVYIEFIDKCTMPKFLACHSHAFGFFGGVPSEILYDNMKNVVVKRLAGTVQWNKTFEAFCVHYGFKPLATPPYSPWAKGKVERPIDYLRNRFWAGYVFKAIIPANTEVRQWINGVASQRIHGTTKEKVEARFLREKPYLGALPRQPYDISEKVYRKVHKDCQLSFGGNRYVVPHQYAGQKILLKIRDGILRVFDDARMVTAYRIPNGKGQTLAHPQFYQRLKADAEQNRRKYGPPGRRGKIKATRGLIKNSLHVEVMTRPLSDYDREVI